MRSSRVRLVLLLVLVTVGTTNAVAVPRAFDVIARDTDPAIRMANGAHRVFLDADVASRGQLLVYLPGTGATTEGQEEFGQTAAGLGYHVIYLMYPNDVAAAICQDDADESTFENFRREILDGRDRDPRVAVGTADSIESRLLMLIRWLDAKYAAQGWGQYLTRGAVDWTRVALAGHSQGGGHAQLLAKDHAVTRVVVLGSPKDYNLRHGRPAAWYGGGATSPSRLFSLVHEQDTQAISHAQQLENLKASGLATMADIDRTSPPYGHARVLSTNQPGKPVNSALAHLGLVFDFMLPRTPDGSPAYRPAWIYMLTEPVDD